MRVDADREQANVAKPSQMMQLWLNESPDDEYWHDLKVTLPSHRIAYDIAAVGEWSTGNELNLLSSAADRNSIEKRRISNEMKDDSGQKSFTKGKRHLVRKILRYICK